MTSAAIRNVTAPLSVRLGQGYPADPVLIADAPCFNALI